MGEVRPNPGRERERSEHDPQPTDQAIGEAKMSTTEVTGTKVIKNIGRVIRVSPDAWVRIDQIHAWTSDEWGNVLLWVAGVDEPFQMKDETGTPIPWNQFDTLAEALAGLPL